MQRTTFRQFYTMFLYTTMNVDTLTYILAIYCSYEFGQYQYKKIFKLCHDCTYNCFQYISTKQYKQKWGNFKKENNSYYILME